MMRRGFSMLMAIAVIVIMMGVSAMVFSLSNQMVASTTTQYHKEQAILLAKSYTEYTLMAVTANLGTVGGGVCLDGVTGDVTRLQLGPGAMGTVEGGMGYRITTQVSYIGNGSPSTRLLCNRVLNVGPIVSNISPSIIIDVYVRYRDTSMHVNGDSPWMTYHRRTLQKI